MSSLVVIGTQWGDEGKGKLVDYLTSNAHYVVRFQGGNNAGHTLVVDGVKTKLSLVPSGILRPQVKCLLGAGCVVNGTVLLGEFSMLKEAGVNVTPERLVLDENAHLIMPYHIAVDQAREELKGDKKIGTTGRGIGPAYEDAAARIGIRLAELRNLASLRDRVIELCEQKDLYLKAILNSKEGISFAEVWGELEKLAPLLTPFLGDVGLELEAARKHGKRIVFEGAQGTLLDKSFGSIPYVTSSNTIAGAVSIGCGIGPKSVDYVLGVTKAYLTRVGSGPFPTELHNDLGERLRSVGAEFGTVTGRPRRCGWFDAVLLKKAVRLNGIDSLAITKLDVLSGLSEIKICVKYLLDGKEIEEAPALNEDLERVQAKYITFAGWDEDLSGVEKWYHLPSNARLYLSALSEIVGCPISMVSIGPERRSTLFPSGGIFLEQFLESI